MESLCPKCKSAYNSSDKHLIMLPCGDSICLTCFDQQMQPQESKIVCPECLESLDINQKFREKITQMKKTCSGLMIMCDHHPHQQASIFCKQHKVFVCDRCALNDHADHRQHIIESSMKDLDCFNEKAIGYLTRLRDYIDKLLENISLFQLNQKSFASSAFMSMISDIQKTLSHHLITEQEQQYLSFFEIQHKEVIAKIPKQIIVEDIALEFDQYSQQTFNITLNEQQLLKRWIASNVKFELIYRGSRDGFKAKKFYELCSDQGPTISLIKSEHNQVFGGFISISWKVEGPTEKEDSKAFIFSLTKREKFEQTGQSKEAAVRPCDSWFICMGRGAAFTLYSDCDINKNSCCLFTKSENYNTYRRPKGIQISSDEGRDYMAGSEYFKVLEVETYKCISL